MTHIITFIYPTSCSGGTGAIETSPVTERKFFQVFLCLDLFKRLDRSLCVMVTSASYLPPFSLPKISVVYKSVLFWVWMAQTLQSHEPRTGTLIVFTVKGKKMSMRKTVLLPLLGSGLRKQIWYLTECEDMNLCGYHLHVIIRQQEFIGIN